MHDAVVCSNAVLVNAHSNAMHYYHNILLQIQLQNINFFAVYHISRFSVAM